MMKKAMMSIMEYHQANGNYMLIGAEYIGALTSSPLIISMGDVELGDNGVPVPCEDAKVWWFPNYEIVNELHELLKNRSIIFER
jgi:hypothetical protein